ncbi:MAG TPA: hypothetical protein ENO03_00850 [Candidatus Aminicenantes bacterium]|nr:hypothetical protein [Candidatus Aminicenantes bacterium]HDT12883.1 hypothetical protein [Candidatus Aminicenantes bacterium]
MKITKRLALADLAAVVSTACLKQGLDVVLSGGACVAIYTGNSYVSYDLDFVLRSPARRKAIRSAMTEIGFSGDGRHFRHPETPYIVEFLQPPLSVSQEPVREIREIVRRRRTLKLLSPTDCVKDRLAAYYHWDDRPSLEQAILVCLNEDVDLREIRRWTQVEGMKDKHGRFLQQLNQRQKKSAKNK